MKKFRIQYDVASLMLPPEVAKITQNPRKLSLPVVLIISDREKRRLAMMMAQEERSIQQLRVPNEQLNHKQHFAGVWSGQ